MTTEDVRRYYRFYGQVQGVGFRWHAMNAARDLHLSGRVKNLPDGSVEAEIQGSRQAISAWLQTLYNDRYIKITDLKCKDLPLQEDASTFYVDSLW